MRRYFLIFFLSFAVLCFFLTPNINTGDAGDFVAATHFLSVAHPSGYPLYLLIAKAFSFLPFGNEAFKLSLVSALFSSLSVTLLYRIVFRLTGSGVASFFTSALLFTSYSFFTQSLVAKFYTLNLFLILAILSLVLFFREQRGGVKSEHAFCLISFLLGLSAANHHTGLIIALPVMIALFFGDLRNKPLKRLSTLGAVGLALFSLGFLLNAYILIRGWGADFFNAAMARSLSDFYAVITRQAYNEGGTISVAGYAFQGIDLYWYGFKNFIQALANNFGIPSVALFIVGCFFLCKKEPRLLAVLLSGFLLYGPFLARLVIPHPSISEREYYVAVHQYFLPAYALFSILAGLGFFQCVQWLLRLPFRHIQRVVPVAVAIIPLTFIISRAADSNYRTNYVPYQATKDILSILPVDSILLTFGDNATYQGWYMRLVGRYREDVGQLAAPSNRDRSWRFEGCNRDVYGNIFPSIYTRSMKAMKPLLMKRRFYATDTLQDESPYKKYLNSSLYSLVNLYVPNDEPMEGLDAFLRERALLAEKIVSHEACLSHLTDDLFTRRICSRYTIHFTELARYLSGREYGVTGKKASLSMKDDKMGESMLLYTMNVTERNEPYLILATQIQEFNQWKILYLRK